MTTLDPHATPRPAATDDQVAGDRGRVRWAWTGTVTGLLGLGATLLTDTHPMAWYDKTANRDVVDDVSRGMAHVSIILGFLTVVGLVVLAAMWRRLVEPRAASSTAARVVTHGLLAASGALTLGYGYKGMLAIYLPGGSDDGFFDREALYMMYVLNDFGSFIGWFGVTISAGAVAWMALRERTISRWIGVWSLVPVLAVVAMTGGTGLPGFPGVVTPIWMVVAFAGLALGRSPVTR